MPYTTYVNIMKCHKSYARHRRIYKDVAIRRLYFVQIYDTLILLQSLVYKRRQSNACLSNTACKTFQWKVKKWETPRLSNIFAETSSYGIYVPQDKDLSLTPKYLNQMLLILIFGGKYLHVSQTIKRVQIQYLSLDFHDNC